MGIAKNCRERLGGKADGTQEPQCIDRALPNAVIRMHSRFLEIFLLSPVAIPARFRQ